MSHSCSPFVPVTGKDIVLPRDREYIPVLSVRQPWASLIAGGVKTIEIRKWTTRVRGPLAIHASQTFDKEGYDFLRGLDPGPSFKLHLRDEPLGCIIAVVDLESIVQYNDPSDFALDSLLHYNAYPWYRPGLYGWRFKDVKKVEPLDHRGSPGLSRVLSQRLEVIE